MEARIDIVKPSHFKAGFIQIVSESNAIRVESKTESLILNAIMASSSRVASSSQVRFKS